MSLAIETDAVTHVLLADGWHHVKGKSFDTDAYEYLEGGRLLVGGGQVDGVPNTGFRFTDDEGHILLGPLTAILAVRIK